MIKKLSNIIEGWLNRFRKVHPVKEALFRDRLQICHTNECGKLKAGICTACGCPVKAKTRSVMEECPENMWNPVMYEYEGRRFIDVFDLPNEVHNELLNWMWNNDKEYEIGDIPCTSALGWDSWLEFKEYLKELKWTGKQN